MSISDVEKGSLVEPGQLRCLQVIMNKSILLSKEKNKKIKIKK
jgi:hypothetical protein